MDNQKKGLYDPSFEHDNCGIGAVVSIKGIKTHQTVSDALKIVENLEHRAGKDASGETGDGVKTVAHEQKVKVEDDQTPAVPTIFAEWKMQEGFPW